MFDEVVSAVITTLRDKGIPAAAQYRDGLLSEDKLVCVGIRSGRMLSSGAGEYLGLRQGREIFGFRAEITAAVDIFARSAAGYLEMLDMLGGALGSLPGGLRGAEFSYGETEPDAETGLYRLPAELRGTAYFSAELDEESGEFSDFTLRGVLK